MSIAKLKATQWEALGEFQRELSKSLDIAWEIHLDYGNELGPGIDVTLKIPRSHPWHASYYEKVNAAFNAADIPDYAWIDSGPLLKVESWSDFAQRTWRFRRVKSRKSVPKEN